MYYYAIDFCMSHGIDVFAHLVAVKCEVYNTTSTREI